MQDWKALFDEGLVIGNPTNESNQRIAGAGRITARREEALKQGLLRAQASLWGR